MKEKFDNIKTELLRFTELEVEKFLLHNSNKTYYAFAYDCNAEYAEVNLCFSTEEEFKKTLNHYQNGEYSQYYQIKEDILDLKYNTGDWEYQCFASMNVFSENELTEIFQKLPDDDHKSWHSFTEQLMQLFTLTLFEFSETKTFDKISKTNDFKFFCIDHDEDFEDVENRLMKIKSS
ncbi:MAG: DUF4303 domain-containing protein [Thermonemataceae bacterium]